MNLRPMLISFLALSLGSIAAADGPYTIHESLQVGQAVTYSVDQTTHTKKISTTAGKQTVSDTQDAQHWIITVTVLAEHDGSAVREKAYFDPNSSDTSGASNDKTACPFAGRTIFLARHDDGTITHSFQGTAGDDDISQLDSIIVPDEDFFPDHPVSVGDVWDNSAKYGAELGLGADDRAISKCRLDWVKTIDGRNVAQISDSVGAIYHEDGNVEEDMGFSLTMLVDVDKGFIFSDEGGGSSKYSTPAGEATQVTGGVDFTFKAKVIDAPKKP